MPRRAPDGPTRVLLDRIAARLPGRPVREVAMFGVTAVMVDDAMLVAAGPEGSLLARVPVADDAALLDRPEAARAEMGRGRSMGPGWIRVDAAAVEDEQTLDLWLRAALARTP